MGENEFDGLAGRVSQIAGSCRAAQGHAMGLATARMHLSMLGALAPVVMADVESQEFDPSNLPPEAIEELIASLEENPELAGFLPPELKEMIAKLLEENGEEAEEEAVAEAEEAEEEEAPEPKPSKQIAGDLIDGIPEAFVGPMLGELVAHEVGHTIGLRHNFKASGAYELADINSEEFKGTKPWSASVMDYNGINIRMPGDDETRGDVQGDFSSIHIGPYDKWAIAYGYGGKDYAKVLERVAEPELQYGTDEDTWGPDPLARRYDLSADPLDWCENQMELVATLRETLLDNFVEDGESWSRARMGYSITLNEQVKALSAMANWVGGSHVYRDKKGDPNGRAPIEVVDADTQRAALNFVIENSFYDEAFGLTPELLEHLTVDKWWGSGNMNALYADPPFPVHDTILGVQSSAMSMILNPTTLRRVMDNEVHVPADEDAITLAEVMRSVTESAWSEVLDPEPGKFTDRAPMISSLRRNLQSEHVDRLIDLAMPGGLTGPAAQPVAQLAAMHLRMITESIEDIDAKADDYTVAHLMDTKSKIDKALSRRVHLQPQRHGRWWLDLTPGPVRREPVRRLIPSHPTFLTRAARSGPPFLVLRPVSSCG